jgi:hypothetical protein
MSPSCPTEQHAQTWRNIRATRRIQTCDVNVRMQDFVYLLQRGQLESLHLKPLVD